MPTHKNVQQLIASLTIAEKVGQLFVLAFAGKDRDYAVSLVKDMHIGGFYITDDNASNLVEAKQLAQQLQHQASLRVCDAPLLLAVDQEGAWGILAQETDLGPGNLALGKIADLALTTQMYQVFAEQMQAVGYNTLLSPCADINADPDNPIIGQRAFGEQPEQVAYQVAAAVKGINQSANLACAKHFPGHGDTHTDSHRDLPIVDKSLSQLLAQDLRPFKAAIEQNVSLIMTSHIQYPQLDPDYPATLSKTILTDLLIEQFGFDGLIITDSMNMWAMRKHYQPEQAAILALKAGAHLIMLSEEHYENETTDYKTLQAQTINGVIGAIETGELAESVIDHALSKVLCCRYQKLNQSAIKPNLTSAVAQSVSTQACKQAIKVLRDEAKLLPLKDDKFYLCFMADPKGYERIVNSRGIGPNDPRCAKDGILTALKQDNRAFELLEYSELKARLDKNELLDAPLVLVTEDYPLAGERFDVNAQVAKVRSCLQHNASQTLVLAMRSDYELVNYSDLSTYVCAYSSRYLSAKLAAKSLFEK